MNKLLLNLFALLLLPPGMAFGQKPVAAPNPDTIVHYTLGDRGPNGPPYHLTELQNARLDAARQEIFRWQDKMNEALEKFSAICAAAQTENKWPAVQCSLTDLAVTPISPPQIPPTAPEKK
jgi:hypothetical protein